MFHFTTNPPYPEYRQSVAQKYAKISKCKMQSAKLSSQAPDFPQFSRLTSSPKQFRDQTSPRITYDTSAIAPTITFAKILSSGDARLCLRLPQMTTNNKR
jgi:hypothetical protein